MLHPDLDQGIRNKVISECIYTKGMPKVWMHFSLCEIIDFFFFQIQDGFKIKQENQI